MGMQYVKEELTVASHWQHIVITYNAHQNYQKMILKNAFIYYLKNSKKYPKNKKKIII